MSNSDKAVKPDGTRLYGNAATLYIASQHGGMDQYIGSIVDDVALAVGRATYDNIQRRTRRAKLSVVNSNNDDI
ncbi:MULTISPECIES: hypothetical protein [Pectobacterium]|uniref:hypothetical protein n=1 Tax=Pectobacterium TaxID=122277 RepID=UPI000E709D79|nr:hypothetical protein [Pectobacterium versatile]RJL49056.1 hypothetical protein D5073_20565 [Pectobacterium versatile]RJL54932.1 hypothetical protein D5076_17850 [Pectobacterium versatile]RJL56301.1 hypothetical protein D5080_21720 [Pectobacterium versatile]GKW33874.1 hypothetical protein PEC730217_26540 [Pectobacterium carotovorum subsp. carotovorum]